MIDVRCDCVAACVQTGKLKLESKIHAGSIADIQMSTDGTHFVTASFDNLAKLVDTQTLEVRSAPTGKAFNPELLLSSVCYQFIHLYFCQVCQHPSIKECVNAHSVVSKILCRAAQTSREVTSCSAALSGTACVFFCNPKCVPDVYVLRMARCSKPTLLTGQRTRRRCLPSLTTCAYALSSPSN